MTKKKTKKIFSFKTIGILTIVGYFLFGDIISAALDKAALMMEADAIIFRLILFMIIVGAIVLIQGSISFGDNTVMKKHKR